MAYLLYGIVKDPVAIVNSGDTTRIKDIESHAGLDPASSPIPDSRLRGNDGVDTNCWRNNNEILTGVKGKPVIFVDGHGLCAVVSELDVKEDAPPVTQLLDYSRVVENLHSRQAVIPMRYGCYLNGIHAIREVLKARRCQYETLLAELSGYVEMGIRILLPEKERCLRQGETMSGQRKKECKNISPEGTTVPGAEPSPSGRAYLALRKVHYRMQEETSHDRQALIDRYVQAFSGLYAKHRTETDAKKDAVIVSLYFLTPKSAVTSFRQIFDDVRKKENGEAMLSGPWPPYNFVTTELAPATDSSFRA